MNQRPHGPEPCALAKLSYIPNCPGYILILFYSGVKHLYWFIEDAYCCRNWTGLISRVLVCPISILNLACPPLQFPRLVSCNHFVILSHSNSAPENVPMRGDLSSPNGSVQVPAGSKPVTATEQPAAQRLPGENDTRQREGNLSSEHNAGEIRCWRRRRGRRRVPPPGRERQSSPAGSRVPAS